MESEASKEDPACWLISLQSEPPTKTKDPMDTEAVPPVIFNEAAFIDTAPEVPKVAIPTLPATTLRVVASLIVKVLADTKAFPPVIFTELSTNVTAPEALKDAVPPFPAVTPRIEALPIVKESADTEAFKPITFTSLPSTAIEPEVVQEATPASHA
jgi:hypothetical protein